MISPCRRHQSESLSVESSPLSLWSTNPRLPRSLRRFHLSLSFSLSISSMNPRLCRSLRRFHLSLSISSMNPRLPRSLDDSTSSRSPRRLRVSLALHDGSPRSSFTPPLSLRPVAILDEIKPKVKAKCFPSLSESFVVI
ncbi:hypothetical protein Bca52824_040494 [Brassica carinata]|uniref:Uncharacterized protein n=1 Tax=Brassica carinata TaxID=52824 RepID=A0A8X7RT59_BRACI|nr:hypothetical protein Bca52824_040494 [Brassica carinata]